MAEPSLDELFEALPKLELLLVRHANTDAADGGDDAKRDVSDEGRAQVRAGTRSRAPYTRSDPAFAFRRGVRGAVRGGRQLARAEVRTHHTARPSGFPVAMHSGLGTPLQRRAACKQPPVRPSLCQGRRA